MLLSLRSSPSPSAPASWDCSAGTRTRANRWCVAGGHRRRFTAAGIAGAIICLGAIFAAQGRAVESWSIVQDPDYTALNPIEPAFLRRPITVGHWFKYAYTNDDCGREKKITNVRLVERPATNARPFKSAVIYVTARFEGKSHEVRNGVSYELPCTAAYVATPKKIRTKRPASSLIFFDGSSKPPHRIWPPVETSGMK